MQSGTVVVDDADQVTEGRTSCACKGNAQNSWYRVANKQVFGLFPRKSQSEVSAINRVNDSRQAVNALQ